MNRILIYCQEITPRLEFVTDFIFREILGVEVKLTAEAKELQKYPFVINYSGEIIHSVFQVVPYGLLEERGIRKQPVPVIHNDEATYLFPVKGQDISFDPFSAVFYLLSRYEEYLPHKKDRYGRFQAINSILWKENLLDKPVVNQWIRILAGKISEYYPDIHFQYPAGLFVPTLDIDNPWAFLNKSLYRKIGGISKDILSLNYNKLTHRLSVLRQENNDPYDSYDFIQTAHSDELCIFFLMGHRSRHDNKISSRNPAWANIVNDLSKKFTCGIHPSFHSNRKRGIIKEEKETLEHITNKKIYMSRQHFLKLNLPETYRNLISVGISQDYSMGYAEVTGFRAGTSFSFLFYDLEAEETTGLRIFPFAVMDRTLKDYLQLDPGKARETISGLISAVNEYGGNFVSIWHNESLGNSSEWQGWREVYEFLLSEGKRLGS